MPTLSFHSGDKALLQAVEERIEPGGSRSAVLESALVQYFRLLAEARRGLKARLTDEELCLICDALNGTLIDDYSVKFMRMEIADACELNRLDEKWGVDAAKLDAKFGDFTLTELMALADAVRRFWNRVAEGENTATPAEMGILNP